VLDVFAVYAYCLKPQAVNRRRETNSLSLIHCFIACTHMQVAFQTNIEAQVSVGVHADTSTFSRIFGWHFSFRDQVDNVRLPLRNLCPTNIAGADAVLEHSAPILSNLGFTARRKEAPPDNVMLRFATIGTICRSHQVQVGYTEVIRPETASTALEERWWCTKNLRFPSASADSLERSGQLRLLYGVWEPFPYTWEHRHRCINLDDQWADFWDASMPLHEHRRPAFSECRDTPGAG